MNRAMRAAALAVVIAFAAGIATGWGIGRVLAPEPPAPGPGAWLTHELHLDPEQEAKMAEIWSSFAENVDGGDRAQWRQLYEVREQRVRDMLSEEQAKEYDVIRTEWESTREAMNEERMARRDAAVRATMEILTEPQKEKYRAILDDLDKRGGPRRHSPSWRGDSAPSPPPQRP